MNELHDAPEIAIVAVAKDEFLGLIDWVAWHLAQGFTRILVVNNESRDGTTELLEALQEVEALYTLEMPGVEGGIQETAYELAVNELRETVPFAAFIDVDEYFVSHDSRTVAEHLRSTFGEEAVSAVLVNWRVFGSGGRRFSTPDAVVSTHYTCAPVRDRWQHQVKSVVRVADLDRMRIHVPQLSSGAGRRVHVDGTPFSSASSSDTRLVDGFSVRYVQSPVTHASLRRCFI